MAVVYDSSFNQKETDSRHRWMVYYKNMGKDDSLGPLIKLSHLKALKSA